MVTELCIKCECFDGCSLGFIDIVVNNAGYGMVGTVETVHIAEAKVHEYTAHKYNGNCAHNNNAYRTCSK
jgi:hypothetical protein